MILRTIRLSVHRVGGVQTSHGYTNPRSSQLLRHLRFSLIIRLVHLHLQSDVHPVVICVHLPLHRIGYPLLRSRRSSRQSNSPIFTSPRPSARCLQSGQGEGDVSKLMRRNVRQPDMIHIMKSNGEFVLVPNRISLDLSYRCMLNCSLFCFAKDFKSFEYSVKNLWLDITVRYLRIECILNVFYFLFKSISNILICYRCLNNLEYCSFFRELFHGDVSVCWRTKGKSL